MTINLPTVKQLRYFVALVDEQHFGRAAEKSFVSQSAFSTAIRELERTLGTQLVERTNRQVNVTTTGQSVAAAARDCLASLENLVEMAQGPREPLTGDLRLGVIPTIAPFTLPAVLPRLRRAYPELRLFLTEEQTLTLHKRLLDGQLDAVLLALPFDLHGTEVMSLFKDRFLLAYQERTNRVDPDNYRVGALEANSVILLEDGHCLRDHALDACRLRGTAKLNRFTASSLLTLVEMVDADLGISYLPEMAEGSSLLRNTRVRLKPMGDKSYRTIGLAWRKDSAREEEFRLLGEFLRSNR